MKRESYMALGRIFVYAAIALVWARIVCEANVEHSIEFVMFGVALGLPVWPPIGNRS